MIQFATITTIHFRVAKKLQNICINIFTKPQSTFYVNYMVGIHANLPIVYMYYLKYYIN